MKDNCFKMLDEFGKEKVCEIICTIKDEKNNKNYLVYDEDDEITASSFTIEDGKYIIKPINEEELEYVNQKLNEKIEDAFKEE